MRPLLPLPLVLRIAACGSTALELGTIAPGYLASLTVLSLDPFQIGEKNPPRLLEGKIVMTIVSGQIVNGR